MKVLHISAANIDGGAGRGTLWLHRAFQSMNVESKILTNSLEEVTDSNIVYHRNIGNKCYDIEKSILSEYPNKLENIFSLGIAGVDFMSLDEYKEADIIHLHWVNDCYISMRDLIKIDKPIVWTFRDMWPMTGGCHYSMDCTKFIESCGNCPTLNSSDGLDISHLVWRMKKHFLNKNIYVVGISSWVSSLAKKSSLFKDFNIRTILNNVDTTLFIPYEKITARKNLNLPIDKKIILVGAKDLKDFYKGLDKFLEACREIDTSEYHLCSFGLNSDLRDEGLNFSSYSNFEYIQDTQTLNKLYASADVFVAPSTHEAFGKTIVESMLSGTPVVCFDATGPHDLVEHKVDGYKAQAYSIVDMAFGIEWIIKNVEYKALVNRARYNAQNKFDNNVIAKQYLELYKEILQTHRTETLSGRDAIDTEINALLKTNEINRTNDFDKLLKKFNQELRYDIKQNKQYIIYGAGTVGKLILALFQDNILCFLDKTSENMGIVENRSQVFSPKNISNLEYDGIIISVLGKEKEIIEYLVQTYKISREKIICIELDN